MEKLFSFGLNGDKIFLGEFRDTGEVVQFVGWKRQLWRGRSRTIIRKRQWFDRKRQCFELGKMSLNDNDDNTAKKRKWMGEKTRVNYFLIIPGTKTNLQIRLIFIIFLGCVKKWKKKKDDIFQVLSNIFVF